MKKSIFLFFAAILCATNVWAEKIYLYPSNNWKEGSAAFWVHSWNGSGDKTGKMTPAELGLYEYEIGNNTQCLFVRQDGSKNSIDWDNNWYKTGNQNIPSDKRCYKVVNWHASGTGWIAVPSAFVAGDSKLLGSNWNEGDANNKMTKIEEGTYVLEKNGVTLTKGDYEYKVTNGSWDWSLGNGNSNAILSIESDGKYNITFTYTYSASSNTVSAIATPVYSVIVNSGEGGTASGAGECVSGNSINISAEALENYEFVNWTIASGTGSFGNASEASTTFQPTSNATIQANFRSTVTYSLTLQGGTGIASVTGNNDNVTLDQSYNISAEIVDGYSFAGWTADVAANAEITDASLASTSVVVKNGSVVLTASATEITSTLTTANTYSEGTPDIAAPTASVSKVGVATTATITAASNAAYALTSWTLTNCERTDGRAANATEITIKGLGNDNEASVVANYTKIPEETVYFVNNKEWNTVNAYAWNKPNDTNNGWPGVAATKTEEKVAGFDVYSFTAIEGQYTNVIFNDGGFQTADLVWTAGKYYWMGAETDFAGATKEEVEEALAAPVVYESVYFVNAEKWTAVNIYTWSPNVASWPGVAMTKEAEQLGGYDVYSYTIEKGTTFGGFNFNEGDQKRKTDDLTWTAGKYYVIDNWYTKAEAEAKLATLVKYDYYITGSLVGGWNPDQQGLVKDGELYKATFTELNAGTYEFKITAGDWEHQWNYSNLGAAYEEVSQGVDNEGNPNGNIKIVTEEAKNITVIFDAIAGKITFEGLTQISGGTTTSLDNLNTTVAPVKMIENGQLFVIKNGVKYNVLGAIVK